MNEIKEKLDTHLILYYCSNENCYREVIEVYSDEILLGGKSSHIYVSHKDVKINLCLFIRK